MASDANAIVSLAFTGGPSVLDVPAELVPRRSERRGHLRPEQQRRPTLLRLWAQEEIHLGFPQLGVGAVRERPTREESLYRGD